jgi:hypothetical protein
VRLGQEKRDVEVEDRFVEESLCVDTIRLDTGDLVDTRRMSATEIREMEARKQRALFEGVEPKPLAEDEVVVQRTPGAAAARKKQRASA